MLFMRMDLLNYQYLDKMNNNIGILCYEGEAALRGEPRIQPLPVSPALTNHRTGPPPISPNKRKLSMDQGDEELDCENDHVSKMSRMFNPHLNKTSNGDYRKEHRERSRSPIERAAAPTMSLHANHIYASIPSLSVDQPLALTKTSMDATRTVGITPTLTSVERQQNRPSVITCASANNRNCSLSHCPIAHSGCGSGPAYRRPSSTTTACDPVVEEHFRRSLGKNYKEPEPVANSVSITGSVDDHFAKALGDTWLQIKAAKDGVSSSPDLFLNRCQVAANIPPVETLYRCVPMPLYCLAREEIGVCASGAGSRNKPLVMSWSFQ
ncbi:transcription cofactor vestigial-like protein 4 isoform X2 [Pipra filicauda]|uniref:Transcription cofactor vestigial-like protein 4 isoform X2 n=1 Tax=Pipra filicauda TaxID=649802 RepID=A0A6J2IWF0_9PASS|nr:transcription cofactor vestigial-like protein 4 isoform X2 [Pipra filicauda]